MNGTLQANYREVPGGGWLLAPSKALPTVDANTVCLCLFKSTAPVDETGIYTISKYNTAPTLVYNPSLGYPTPALSFNGGNLRIAGLFSPPPAKWSITIPVTVTGANGSYTPLLQLYYAGTGTQLAWIFTGDSATFSMAAYLNSSQSDGVASISAPNGANGATASWKGSGRHTCTATYDGTFLRQYFDGQLVRRTLPVTPLGGTITGGVAIAGDESTSSSYALPCILYYAEFRSDCLTPAQVVQRHNDWAYPMPTPTTRWKHVGSFTNASDSSLQEPSIISMGDGTYKLFCSYGSNTGGNNNRIRGFLIHGPLVEGMTFTVGAGSSQGTINDLGDVLGNGAGGESGYAQRGFVFIDPVSGTWYLYYSTPSASSPIYYATSTDKGVTWTKQGTALNVVGGTASGFTITKSENTCVIYSGGTYYMFCENTLSGYGGTWSTSLYSASSPVGPFTAVNSGNLLTGIAPANGAGASGGGPFVFYGGGRWHMYDHACPTAGASAPSAIYHHVADSITQTRWEFFNSTNQPEFPEIDDDNLGFGGTPVNSWPSGNQGQSADYTHCFDGINMIAAMENVGPSNVSYLHLYIAPNTTPDQLVTPDAGLVVGAGNPELINNGAGTFGN